MAKSSKKAMKTLFQNVLRLLVFTALTISTAQSEPFSVTATLQRSGEEALLSLSFHVEAEHYLYPDAVAITSSQPVSFSLHTAPTPTRKYDDSQGKEIDVYATDARLVYRVTGLRSPTLAFSVAYQGCNDSFCFLPESVSFTLPVEGNSEATDAASQEQALPPQDNENDASWRSVADTFRGVRRASGYMSSERFLAFLAGTDADDAPPTDEPIDSRNEGIWITILLILVGGLALNLTPCVLPMIPINIAIIGAGAQGGSRTRGFFLGSIYGAGIALVYGALGLVVVLTGVKFGSLNASPWFNAAIAVLFGLLAMAMFGFFQLDFSSFMSGSTSHAKRGTYLAAFIMGGVAALLAGACVAPVVISVLLLSASLYAKGATTALLLPFLLGIGMALPWPFAGAGLSFLPKPGRWMEWIKRGFGILITAIAIWYATQAYHLFQNRFAPQSFGHLLEEAAKQNKPIFVDFWATWCKSCLRMEDTTFADPVVKQALHDVAELKFQAEELSNPHIKEVLDYYEIPGLPMYLILEPIPQPRATP